MRPHKNVRPHAPRRERDGSAARMYTATCATVDTHVRRVSRKPHHHLASLAPHRLRRRRSRVRDVIAQRAPNVRASRRVRQERAASALGVPTARDLARSWSVHAARSSARARERRRGMTRAVPTRVVRHRHSAPRRARRPPCRRRRVDRRGEATTTTRRTRPRRPRDDGARRRARRTRTTTRRPRRSREPPDERARDARERASGTRGRG